MEHDQLWRQKELEEQIEYPWDWDNEYSDLDGWELNNYNRRHHPAYAHELAEELGPITIPHKIRRF